MAASTFAPTTQAATSTAKKRDSHIRPVHSPHPSGSASAQTVRASAPTQRTPEPVVT